MAGVWRRTGQATLSAFVLAGFWIGCVATVRLHEMLVGAAAVALGAASSVYVANLLPLRFEPAPKCLAQLWRLPWSVVNDSLAIVLVLIRDLLGAPAPSLFRSAPYRAVDRSGSATAQRVLATAFSTVTPNMIVLGVDCERRQLLFHQLKVSGVPGMTQRLGAESGR